MTNSGNQPIQPTFSPWEHLQRVLMDVHNRRVREYFPDLADLSDDNLNIATPRQSLLRACLLRDDDSAPMTLARMWLADISLGGASSLHPALYTTPVDLYQETNKFSPQVTLFFSEDMDDVEQGFSQITAEISFRLVQERFRDINPSEARTLAQELRTEFGNANGYRWRKGRVRLNYRNHEQGINTRIQAFSESEGREVLQKVLSIQEFTIDNSKLTITELGETPPTIPPNRVIYGQSRRLPRRAPVGFVRFKWADLHIWGLQNAITLVDLSGIRRTTLI